MDLLKRLSAVAVVGLSLAGCQSLGTTVAEDDPETEVQNVSLGRAVMESLGAVETRRQPINFQPRAPLVVPPSTSALVPPEAPGQIAGSPDWPKDPERVAQERLKAAADLKKRYGDTDPRAVVDVRLPTPPRAPGDLYEFRPYQTASERNWRMGKVADDTGVYDRDGNPRRQALVQPPVAYLQPAPGVPVAIPEEKKSDRGLLSSLKFW